MSVSMGQFSQDKDCNDY